MAIVVLLSLFKRKLQIFSFSRTAAGKSAPFKLSAGLRAAANLAVFTCIYITLYAIAFCILFLYHPNHPSIFLEGEKEKKKKKPSGFYKEMHIVNIDLIVVVRLY